MTTPRKRGRPEKAPAERKSELMTIRLTPEESDRLFRLALARDKSVPELVRGIIDAMLLTFEASPQAPSPTTRAPRVGRSSYLGR